MANTAYNAPEVVAGWQKRALIVGIIGLIATAAGFFIDKDQFFRAYLVGFVLWSGVTLGGLGMLMLQYLTGGTWGVVTRRIFEAAARNVTSIVPILFIPVILGINSLYHWTHPGNDPILLHKSGYLNIPFFIGRAIFYFVIWAFLATTLAKLAKQHDETGDHAYRQRMADWSGPGFLAYGLTMSFAAFDWVMSLDPHWYSTIYGLLLIAGQGISLIAFTTLIASSLAKRDPMNHVYQPQHFHDLGMLLFALIMVWAYFSYSQLVIIWSGNLPEETPWYVRRFNTDWKYLGWVVLIFHFVVPFSILLSKNLKKKPAKLVLVAAWMLLMRVADLIWLIGPEPHNGHAGVGSIAGAWMYLAAPIGIGGIWMWFFCRNLQSRSLLPVNDPQFEQALAATGHH
jgi:hypothetical protein